MISRKVLWDVGFQNNVREKLKMISQDREFSDVTLTSDGISFQSHKVVLAATNTFFIEYFHRQKGDHFICMGVSSSFLASMLDIVYFGEARMEEENCKSFIKYLQDCRVLEPKMWKERNEKLKHSQLCNFGTEAFVERVPIVSMNTRKMTAMTT